MFGIFPEFGVSFTGCRSFLPEFQVEIKNAGPVIIFAAMVHYRTCCGPLFVQRAWTSRGCSASILRSCGRTWRSSWGASLRRGSRLRAPLRRVSRLSRHPIRHCCPQVLRVLDLAGLPVLAALGRAASLRPTKRPVRYLSVGPLLWKRRPATQEPSTDLRLTCRAATQKPTTLPCVHRWLSGWPLPVLPIGQGGWHATDPGSPGLNPDFAVSPIFAHRSELRDESPSFEEDPEFRDGLPSFEEDPECRDGLPSSGDMVGHAQSEAKFMNSSSDSADTAFSRVFRDDEKSEGVRQSDSRVQNLPASVSSSELSAHQMGGALAGEVRITNFEPSGMDPERSDGCSL